MKKAMIIILVLAAAVAVAYFLQQRKTQATPTPKAPSTGRIPVAGFLPVRNPLAPEAPKQERKVIYE